VTENHTSGGLKQDFYILRTSTNTHESTTILSNFIFPNSFDAYSSLTYQIIGCAFEVSKELGPGFLETVYKNALTLALREIGLNVKAETPVPVYFRGHNVGLYYTDLLVEGKVIVEVKAIRTLLKEHQAQVIHYLKATGINVGLLINFGNTKIEHRRLRRLPDLNISEDELKI